MTADSIQMDHSSHIMEDYFTPPSSPILKMIHDTCLPLITNYDHLVIQWQTFLGISHYPGKSNESSSSSSHTHPLFSPYRAPLYIHLPLCLASEFGNENFYALWAVLCQFTFSSEITCQLCIVWALTLFVGQFIKDLLHLPRPGLQQYNPSSPLYYKNPSNRTPTPTPTPNDSTNGGQQPSSPLHRLENQYSAEFGLPSTHSAAISIPIYTLVVMYKHFHSMSSLPPTQYNTVLQMISTVMKIIMGLFCLFWIIFTPLSRLYMGVHSLFDIIGGILIGVMCCVVVYTLQFSFGVLSYLYTTSTGIIITTLIAIGMLYIYPKHDKTWTNSSGDTAVVVGSALGSIIAQFISFSINTPQPIDVYQPNAWVTTPITHLVRHTFPIQYNYLLPPFAYLVDLSQIKTYIQLLFNIDIWLSISLAVGIGCIRLLVTVVLIYSIRLALRPLLFRISRVALGYSPQYIPDASQTPLPSPSEQSSPSSPSQPPTIAPKDNNALDDNHLRQRHGKSHEHQQQDDGQCELSQIASSASPDQGTYDAECQQGPSPSIANLRLELIPSTSSSECNHINHKTTSKGIRPPKTSTLYKKTIDMSIRDIIILEMVDKFIGYGSMGLSAVLILPYLTDFIGLTYYLYLPMN